MLDEIFESGATQHLLGKYIVLAIEAQCATVESYARELRFWNCVVFIGRAKHTKEECQDIAFQTPQHVVVLCMYISVCDSAMADVRT